jgi:hypothetical protein
MISPSRLRRLLPTALLAALVAAATGARPAVTSPPGTKLHPAARSRGEAPMLADALFGASGKLKARIVLSRDDSLAVPVLERFFGETAPDRPGVYTLDDSIAGLFSFITLRPFSDKTKGFVGAYRVGRWPAEKRRSVPSDAYENPDGFIEVTPDNQDTPVSEHFRLRDFLTHDQPNVWPKELVLREALVDKLELVISDLEAHGETVRRVVVMSGFRTPAYNQRGVGRGRVEDSRHQFGDAADIFIDNDGNGRMDDLNHDGHINTHDVRVLLAAVDRVERDHPELVGGAGVYRATRAHGPFLPVDVRGTRARWGRS